MPLQPRRGIGSGRAGQGLVDPERFLAAAIGLAGCVDDRDDGALDRTIAVGGHGVMHGARQRPAFEQPYLALPGAREGAGGIGHHRDQARGAAGDLHVGHLDRRRIAGQSRGVAAQGGQPGVAPARGAGCGLRGRGAH